MNHDPQNVGAHIKITSYFNVQQKCMERGGPVALIMRGYYIQDTPLKSCFPCLNRIKWQVSITSSGVFCQWFPLQQWRHSAIIYVNTPQHNTVAEPTTNINILHWTW